MEGDDMQTTLSPNQTASAIWSRIVKPERVTFTPELARAILKLDFDRADQEQVETLSTKAQKGALTPEERAELEEYIRVSNMRGATTPRISRWPALMTTSTRARTSPESTRSPGR
jgi:hypothetical protein